jgi:hypothetical protein
MNQQKKSLLKPSVKEPTFYAQTRLTASEGIRVDKGSDRQWLRVSVQRSGKRKLLTPLHQAA